MTALTSVPAELRERPESLIVCRGNNAGCCYWRIATSALTSWLPLAFPDGKFPSAVLGSC